MVKFRGIEPIVRPGGSRLINIGPVESSKRRATGIIMAAISVIMIAALAIFRANEWFTLILVFPYMGAFIGFLQARNKT